MEYKTDCGCSVVESPPNFKIKYCPLHGAAPEMYEALKELMYAVRHSKSQVRGRILTTIALYKVEEK